MYEIYERLLKEKGVTTADVCRATGISQSTMSNWKKRGNAISIKNARLIAQYFDVPLEMLTGDKAITFDTNKIIRAYHAPEQKYYEDDETARLAQEAMEDGDMRILLSAKKDLKPDDFKMIVDMVKRFKETNKDG